MLVPRVTMSTAPIQEYMRHTTIYQLFRKYRGAGAWAARKIGVTKQTVSSWLMGDKKSARLDAEMPKLAAELMATDGQCAWSKADRIRGAGKKRSR